MSDQMELPLEETELIRGIVNDEKNQIKSALSQMLGAYFMEYLETERRKTLG